MLAIYYTMFKLSLPEMKLFKIKVIKTCKLLLYYFTYRAHTNIIVSFFKNMSSSQDLYNIHLKTSLFKAKLYYIDFIRLFLLRKPRNLEALRINCTEKEAKATGKQFSK